MPIKVISVGNITVGGTGKTPMVAYLAKRLSAEGKKVGILSRGYGRAPRCDIGGLRCDSAGGAVGGDSATYSGADDEAFVSTDDKVLRIAQPDRVSAGRKLCNEHKVGVIILDDGFQHFRLARDIDIVMIDSTNPFGNGWLLPGGILRESRSALKRAGLFALTHCDIVPEESLSRLELYLSKYQRPIIRTVHSPVAVVGVDGGEIRLEALKSKRLYGFCGIGNPFTFKEILKGVGNLVGISVFPDHYVYTLEDIARVGQEAVKSGAEMIVTTEKDRMRLGSNLELARPLYFLRIEIKVIKGEDDLRSFLST